jgi:hypothetical protein
MEFEMKYENVNLAWNDKPIMLNMKIENFFQMFLDWKKQEQWLMKQ